MKIEYAARVEIGKKETNDDRILIDGAILSESSRKGILDVPTVAAVCDGCGGYRGGNVAAETVLSCLAAERPESLGKPENLEGILNKCKQEVFRKKEEQPDFSNMCTTVAGCVFMADSIVLFHSGDSRIYRHDPWNLAVMTKDHSIVQQRIDAGELTEEEARLDPDRNIISRCIGIDCLPPDIRLLKVAIKPGDKYLICSDGLWESVLPDQISEILSSDSSLENMAESLVKKALEQGSDDNISLCVCAAAEKMEIKEDISFVLD